MKYSHARDDALGFSQVIRSAPLVWGLVTLFSFAWAVLVVTAAWPF